MINWDTFSLFEFLLDNFPQCLTIARETPSSNTQDTLETKTAFTGFYQFSEPVRWTKEHYDFINARLTSDLLPENLIAPIECHENVRLFACLVLGALLGKFDAGQINDAGFLLGDAHLAGFLTLEHPRICSATS